MSEQSYYRWRKEYGGLRTRGEFELLAALVSNPGRVLSRDNLLDHVSHRDWAPNDRSVDVLIGRVRRKIEENPKLPRLIVTVHGIGYVFAGGVTRSRRMARLRPTTARLSVTPRTPPRRRLRGR